MNWQKKSVLVTGGGGFLGRYIIERLIDLNCKSVKAFGRTERPELTDIGVEFLQGNISDPDFVKDISKGCDIIIHTAAKAGIWGKKSEYYEANVRGTENIINACRTNNIEFLVNTSTPSVVCAEHNIENGNEELPYPASYPAYYPETKAVAEKMVTKAGLNGIKTVSLRPHLIWGVRDSHILPTLVRTSQQGKLKRVGDGKNIVDMTHVKNAAEAHILAVEALEKKPEISGKNYFITDKSPVNLWDWTENFLKDVGAPGIHGTVSFRKAYLAGAVLEKIYTIFNIKQDPPMTRFAAIQLAYSHYFDISAAERDLNYKPIVNYEEAYREAVEWIKEQGKQ